MPAVEVVFFHALMLFVFALAWQLMPPVAFFVLVPLVAMASATLVQMARAARTR
jgi:hypothetical protein